MSRIPPSCLRNTSDTLSSPFVATSCYYFDRQGKQNIALYVASRPLNRILKWTSKRARKTEPFVLQPGLLPIYTQLKALSYVKHMLHMSHSWFKNKTLLCGAHLYLGLFGGPKKQHMQLQNLQGGLVPYELLPPRAIDALVHLDRGHAKKTSHVTTRVSQKLPYYCIHARKRRQKPFNLAKIRASQWAYRASQTRWRMNVDAQLQPSCLAPNLQWQYRGTKPPCRLQGGVYYYGLQYACMRDIAYHQGYTGAYQPRGGKLASGQNKARKGKSNLQHFHGSQQQHIKTDRFKHGFHRASKAPCLFMLLCLHMLKHKIYDRASGSYVPGLKLGVSQNSSKKRYQFFDFQALKFVTQDYRVECNAGEHFSKAICKGQRRHRRLNTALDVSVYNHSEIYNASPKVALCRSFNKPLSAALFLYVNGLFTYAKTQSVHRGVRCKGQPGNVTSGQRFKALPNLAWNGYEGRARSVHLCNKVGSERLKTCVVFDLKLQHPNHGVKSLRPTLSIRL